MDLEDRPEQFKDWEGYSKACPTKWSGRTALGGGGKGGKLIKHSRFQPAAMQ